MPSVMAATVTLTNEIVSSLGTTIVGIGLAAIGYVNTMPQPGDQLTGPIFWMAMLLWMGMPFFGWLCTVIAMRFYKLDKDAMAEIQRVNAERREASKNIS